MATDVKQLIEQMTLEEKASLLGGDDFWHTKAVARLGIPRAMMSDGPHGLRKQDEKADHLGVNESIKAVCFPAACATASSFDTELIGKMGEIIGDECQAEELSIVLGPAVNIKRSPLCGRNFEYFSEDPYLAGKMAAAYINGVQSRHVGTSIKHFALNNQETRRMSVSAQVSERAMREIYFPAFEIAVKEAQPKTVMCSYNKINGVYSADNAWLLTDVLRKDWGFEGFVMTDWGAVDDRVQGVRAGLELEMPGNTAVNDQRIVDAVKAGELDEALVDQACERVLRVVYDYLDNRRTGGVFDREADHKHAAAIETECAVLLENNGVLPLRADAKVVYIGEYAARPRFQGGGSSHINATRVTSALQTAQAKGRAVSYVKGFPFDKDEADAMELQKAVEAAKSADAAVIFAGLPDIIESEGYDRRDMKLPACQDALIEAVLAAQPNTVVVLHNGAPVEAPWADRAAAVLELYLGGEGVGEAADQLLYGEVNPSGHLAETFPMKLEDNPSHLNFPGGVKTVDYAEGVFVGYRYYDTKRLPVRWAFGHGLSYTTFAIGNLRLDGELNDENTVTATVDVSNTGARFGKEVVQLYISDRNGTPGRPAKELKGFAKVGLEPGETKAVSFRLSARDLSYYDERLHDWYAPSGSYAVLVGDASDHITAEAELRFATKKVLPLIIGGDTTMAELMADPRTAPVLARLQGMLMQDAAVLQPTEGEGLGAGEDEMNKAMMLYMPLKSIPSFLPVSAEQMEGFYALLRQAVEG
ncbi:MAG: glycoside hydrolase family 3 C-terminal domain-containing protein [Oscillospiraceae bacterium]|nr:glycoside hydrolase family 3 C-terminal domain-containing protein [Oscillospiraceae bacterium]